ncbi:MAG: 6-O-methylguanine DNA methyltransferase [Acidimicrobiia bacterium]|nr:6-O-methylguanine DNA methyltransferase [Acidimicrobiia bacterium]
MSLDTSTDFSSRVADIVHSIDSGDVLTYGEVAMEAGHPGAARAVAAALSGGVPWWRVVGTGGRIVAPSRSEQIARLREEGHVIDSTVDPPRIAGWQTIRT